MEPVSDHRHVNWYASNTGRSVASWEAGGAGLRPSPCFSYLVDQCMCAELFVVSCTPHPASALPLRHFFFRRPPDCFCQLSSPQHGSISSPAADFDVSLKYFLTFTSFFHSILPIPLASFVLSSPMVLLQKERNMKKKTRKKMLRMDLLVKV